MRSACIFVALVAIAAAAPAPSPQLIDLAGVDAAPDPVLVSAPIDVTSDPVEKRDVGLVKRDATCAPQPAGSGPVPTPDTAAAFTSSAELAAFADTPTPDGYSLAFQNMDGSLSASKYMGLYTLKAFDTLGCASLCDRANGCQAFNMYIERDPTVAPDAVDCPNPPSLTNFKCTLWGAPVVAEQVKNKGQWRASFQVVMTSSNGYNKASPPDPITGFTGPTALGGAINAPLDNGKNTYLGYKYFPFSQTQGYTPTTCADACNAQTGYNSRHPNADGTYATCAGFLKSSPKVTLYPKSIKRSPYSSQGRAATPASFQPTYLPRTATASPGARASSPSITPQPVPGSPRSNNVTWVCPICSYSNPVPSNFDAASANVHTPLPPCLACGIKPPLALILKAAIASALGRTNSSHPAIPIPTHGNQHDRGGNHSSDRGNPVADSTQVSTDSRFQCPRCTFQNHPSLLQCELCGAPLISAEDSGRQRLPSDPVRPESPGPCLDSQAFGFENDAEGVKFSFRAGGEKIFYERLKGAMTQRKWLLQNAPPIPMPNQLPSAISGTPSESQVFRGPRDSRPKVVGIAGLERRGLELRKKTEAVIGGAFEDLEALMASAKEIVALAEEFAQQSTEKGSEGDALLAESATALGMVTTKEMLGSSTGSDSLYVSELSRNLAEYLTDDAKGILRKEGGIMSLVDLWAVFNRTRGGVELISPADFEKAARLWEKLALPVRLREFKNGLLVVQRHDWTDDKTIAQLLAWLQEFHAAPPDADIAWDWARFGRGVTAQEAAVRFGWSIGVASEELEMAEEKGTLCREEGVEGIKYWENWIVHGKDDLLEEQEVTTRLKDLEV
ncbi:MAG: hypothetical protein Q9208_002286 [Pyrenodesmia sp. 3 TL-2023]